MRPLANAQSNKTATDEFLVTDLTESGVPLIALLVIQMTSIYDVVV